MMLSGVAPVYPSAAAGQGLNGRVVAEFVQDEATAESLAGAVAPLLDRESAVRARVVERLGLLEQKIDRRTADGAGRTQY